MKKMPKNRKDRKDRKDEKDDRKPKRGKRPFVLKKRRCRFCGDKNLKIQYMDHQLLCRFVTERGKIAPSRITGTCARHQRKLSKAIKRARNIGLLPFVAE